VTFVSRQNIIGGFEIRPTGVHRLTPMLPMMGIKKNSISGRGDKKRRLDSRLSGNDRA